VKGTPRLDNSSEINEKKSFFGASIKTVFFSLINPLAALAVQNASDLSLGHCQISGSSPSSLSYSNSSLFHSL
jgi:hypothetical protein